MDLILVSVSSVSEKRHVVDLNSVICGSRAKQHTVHQHDEPRRTELETVSVFILVDEISAHAVGKVFVDSVGFFWAGSEYRR